MATIPSISTKINASVEPSEELDVDAAGVHPAKETAAPILADKEQVKLICEGIILTDPDTSVLPIGTDFTLRFTHLDVPATEIEAQIMQLDIKDKARGWTVISDWMRLPNLKVNIENVGAKALHLNLRCDDGRNQEIWLGSYYFYDKHAAQSMPDLIRAVLSAAPFGMSLKNEFSYVAKHLLTIFAVIYGTPEALGENSYYEYENGVATARHKYITLTMDQEQSLLSFEGQALLLRTDNLDIYRNIAHRVISELKLMQWECIIAIAIMVAVRRAYKFSQSAQMGVKSLLQDTATCGGLSLFLIGLLREIGLTANAINYSGEGNSVHVVVEVIGADFSLIIDPMSGTVLATTLEAFEAGEPAPRLDLHFGMDLDFDLVDDFQSRKQVTRVETVDFLRLIPI